jgi:lantibiotic biosynthesis dehydratase-like protein
MPELQRVYANSATSPADEWGVVRQFVLRMAGFPFELLESLALSHSAQAARAGRIVSDEEFALELEEARHRLWHIMQHNDFREALLLSNPACLERLEHYQSRGFPVAPNSNERRLERLFVTYLQRFCAKNESMSFFGPTAYGIFSGESDQMLTLTARGMVEERNVGLSQWALRELQKLLPQDPPPPHPTLARPLDHFLEASSEDQISHLIEFRSQLHSFASTGMPERVGIYRRMAERFQALTGQDAVRNEGTVYGDRMIVYEDCSYAVCDLRMSKKAERKLVGDWAALLEIICYPGELRQQVERQVLDRWMRSRFGHTDIVSFEQVNENLFPDVVSGLEAEAESEWRQRSFPYFQAVHSLLDGREDMPDAAVTQLDLESVWSAIQSNPLAPWPCVISPDFMFHASSMEQINSGDFQTVLGDLHSALGVDGFYARLHPDPATLQADLLLAVQEHAPDYQTVNFVCAPANKTSLATEIPIPEIAWEQTAPALQPQVPLSSLYFDLNGNSMQLFSCDYEKPIYICSRIPRKLRLFALQTFSVSPCGLEHFQAALLHRRQHVPRMRQGDAIFLRETWKIPAVRLLQCGHAGSPAQSFDEIQRLAAELGCPQHVFIKIPGERKPYFVDLENWLLLDMILRQVKKVSASEIVVSEMLPPPDSLWLTDSKGRHTSELRTTFWKRWAR